MTTETSSMRYRSTHEITAEILGTVAAAGDKGISKTKIMYKALLSYAQLKNYLALLTENGLIELKGDDQKWYITGAGASWMKKYRAVAVLQRNGGSS